ncbi:inositol-pentakisphosphate 2-kinase-like isoform X4 [Rhododendron vialii]|uniref:inositol-pentakisphosphate 2-kinase-like isoform X4 n=1 Tax=Rhododendron vialii TaxID=182163 RepID=UPI00266048FE|nr:inositol-pentakisphosphate 2-kinase-like isoform X4 [Rhododendron vialii]
MEVVLELKDADDWIYRGEGAANLVLAYSGSSPTFVGKVLRIQKAPRIESPRNGYDSEDSHSALTNDECLLWRETEDLVSAPTREIAEQLIVSFCPRNFSRRLKRISFPSVLLSELMQPWSTLNVILRFLCLIIQFFRMPKCGFLPVSRFISEENDIKKSITRFEMHQSIKLHQREISEISEYNPLDLFSGSKDRMHKAIKALFVTPQNNFRVFLNGSLILGGLGGGADSTSCMIGEAFENVLNGVIQADVGQRTSNFLHLVTEAISGSGLLDQLLEVQKLDNIDIEGAIHAYYNLVCQPCIACRDLGGEKLSARYANLHSMSSDESLKIVRDYLIAATAKDLSLMISFRTREDRDVESPYNGVFLDSTNQRFEYKESFIDLDMKPLKKMELYYERDQQIVNCYSQM